MAYLSVLQQSGLTARHSIRLAYLLCSLPHFSRRHAYGPYLDKARAPRRNASSFIFCEPALGPLLDHGGKLALELGAAQSGIVGQSAAHDQRLDHTVAVEIESQARPRGDGHASALDRRG